MDIVKTRTDNMTTKTMETGREVDTSLLCDRGLPHYSSNLGEWISKNARTRLVQLCLRGCERELCDKPMPHKSRGRQKEAVTLISEKVRVNRRTVYRWLEGDGVKACDVNAGRLAELAFSFDPIETSSVLREDLDGYTTHLSEWFLEKSKMICEASPCHTNQVKQMEDSNR